VRVNATADADVVDRLVQEFDDSWRKWSSSAVGPPPEIDPILPTAPDSARLELLVDLCCVDLEYRRRLGQNPSPDEYCRRYPLLAAAGDRLADFRTHASRFLPSVGPAIVPSGAEPMPTAIGPYRVIERLGSGGQADVYRAFHTGLHREAAVKLCRTEAIGDPAMLADEARLLAMLDHPGVVRVYDVGVHEGRPYLAGEFIDGRTLDRYAQDSAVSPAKAARLVAALARAVDAAHRLGIAHLDIKPRNVLIDPAGNPRLIDFGLARVRSRWVDRPVNPGEIFGSLGFLPPEQAVADGSAGPRSDLFGLGSVLYFLLTGKPPYRGADVNELVAKAAKADIDWKALESPSIPAGLAAICRRAMARDPAARPADAAALAGELETVLGRPRRAVLWVLAAAAVVGAAVLIRQLGPGAPTPIPEARVRIELHRNGGTFAPADAPPATDGDELRIRADIPAGVHAALILLPGDGPWQTLAAEAPRAAGFELIYPGPGKTRAVGGPAGTMVFLVCLSRDGPVNAEEMEFVWPHAPAQPLPPDGVVLRVADGQVRNIGEEGRAGFIGDVENRVDPETALRERIESATKALNRRGARVFGEAFVFRPRR
jgi:aminoglycoside phosphotransferase